MSEVEKLVCSFYDSHKRYLHIQQQAFWIICWGFLVTLIIFLWVAFGGG
jgi:hypothetical protein